MTNKIVETKDIVLKEWLILRIPDWRYLFCFCFSESSGEDILLNPNQKSQTTEEQNFRISLDFLSVQK